MNPRFEVVCNRVVMRRLAASSYLPSGRLIALVALFSLMIVAAEKVRAQDPSAGEFTFTTLNYRVSERESAGGPRAGDGVFVAPDPSVAQSIGGALITVTRTNGAAG